MKSLEIKIEGSGTVNQVAIRLLEIGRALQLAGNNEEVDDTALFGEDDDVLDVTIEYD